MAYPNFVYVNQVQTSASSSYNSLQASLKLRSFHGLTSTANFTWGHSIDNASDGQDFVPNASQPDNSFNPAAERANSNFDIRKSFRWYWSYEFPNSNFAPWLTNHWSVNGVVTLNDGQPYNVSYLFENDFNGTGEYFGRPDLVGNPFAGTSTPYQYLNLSAFAVPCTVDTTGNCIAGTQHIGNLGRNAFTGPSYRVFDFSVARTFKLGENKELKLQSDFFNVLNHANFTNPMLPNLRHRLPGQWHVAGRHGSGLPAFDRNARHWHRQSVPWRRRIPQHSVVGSLLLLIEKLGFPTHPAFGCVGKICEHKPF